MILLIDTAILSSRSTDTQEPTQSLFIFFNVLLTLLIDISLVIKINRHTRTHSKFVNIVYLIVISFSLLATKAESQRPSQSLLLLLLFIYYVLIN